MRLLEPVGIDSPVNDTGQVVAVVLTFALAIAATVWVFHLWRTERRIWPVLVLIGGMLGCLMEPAFDRMYGLWFNEEGQWHLYTTFGSAQPIWVPAAYLALYGGATTIVVRTLAKRPSMTTVWRMWAGIVVMSLIAEIAYVSVFGVYEYQDHQPFQVAGYPVFLAFTNAMSGVVGGIIIYRLVPLLRGWHHLALLMVVPMAFAADLFGTGMFYLSIRHGFEDPSMLLVSLGALSVAGGVTATVGLLGHILVDGQAPRDPSLPQEPLPRERAAATETGGSPHVAAAPGRSETADPEKVPTPA